MAEQGQQSEYDAAGRLTALVSGGVRMSYTYDAAGDAAGRLESEEHGLTGVVTKYSYTPGGQIRTKESTTGVYI